MNSYNFKNLAGKTFGKLSVLEFTGKNKQGNSIWLVLCDCGNEAIVVGSKLINGHTKSCGCLKKSRDGLSKTRLYRIWRGMINRCENYENDNYYWYGFKGVTICTEWYDFMNFYMWALNNGYDETLSIDRINSNGDYRPDNCRWVTQKEQCNNQYKNRYIEYKGKKYTLSQFSDMSGLRYWTIINRLKLGWSIERIIGVAEVKHGR